MSNYSPTTHTTDKVYHRQFAADSRESLALVAKQITPNSKVLDVGCGAGDLGQYLREAKNCYVFGVDYSAESVAIAAEKLDAVTQLDLNTQSLATVSEQSAEHAFDVIVMADILEHIYTPEQTLRDAQKLLKPDGKLIISIPNAGYVGALLSLYDDEWRYQEEGILDRTHIRFYTKQSTLALLSDAGFDGMIADRVSRDLLDSEFTQRIDSQLDKVRDWLLAKPEGSTYQFIIEARPKSQHYDFPTEQVAPPMAMQHIVKCYWQTAETSAFDEKNMTIQRGRMGQVNCLRFETHASQIRGIRLDFADRRGVYQISRVAIYAGEVPIWQSQPDNTHLIAHDFTAQTAHFPITAIAIDGTANMECQLKEPVSGQALIIEVTIHAPISEQNLAFADVVSLQQHQQALAEKHGLAADLAALHVASNHTIAQLTADLQQLSDESSILSEKYALTVEQLNQRIQRLQATIDSLLQSTSWKITSPLRKVVQRLKKKHMNKRNITVVLPIYRDTAMTIDCIESVLPSVLARQNTSLVMINDASPDADMQSALEAIANKYVGTITLLVNESNLGFVASVNRGMRHHPEDDIVLLNSDVLLPDATWLQRLARDAYQDDDIASVTPLSNNTTICTFPDFLQDNPPPFGLSVTAIDQAFKVGHYPCVEAPTGIGFCLFIRRDALDAVGYFDEAAFGRGYGEENDFCQRAIQHGFRHLISPNLYAYHLGGVSFGADKQALIENASRVIDARYPNYHRDVQVFIAADPLREARLYRMAQLIAQTHLPKIVSVSHGTGGGVEQHIDELAEALADDAILLKLSPAGSSKQDSRLMKLSLANRTTADSLYFDYQHDYARLLGLLKSLGVGLVHYHHTLGFSEQIFSLASDLQVPHVYTVHDYYALGGNPTLCNEKGIYPGFYDEALDHSPLYPQLTADKKPAFQLRQKTLLETAQAVIFPSLATQTIFAGRYGCSRQRVVPHLEHQRNLSSTCITLADKAHYTIGIIGAIGLEKGADLIEAMAVIASENQLPLSFKIIGYAYRSLKQVETTGPFEVEQLPELMREHTIDVAFFASRCPETYSYTLSYALAANLPIFAPQVGAFPERLSGRPLTALFNHLEDAQTLIDELQQFIQRSKGETSDDWAPADAELATQFYLQGEYLGFVKTQPINREFKPEQWIQTQQQPTPRMTMNEKLVIKLWKVYTHPSMAWVNKVVPFRLRRGLKRLLSRQAIHDLVNKHDR